MVFPRLTALRAPHPFFSDLDREWISDLQSFLHVGLPKLIGILLFSWAAILLVNFTAGRILKVAERRDAAGGVRGAQVRTLASVIRATGIGIVVFLALLQTMENVLHFDLAPLLASAGVAGVAIGLAAQTIVKDVINGVLILIEDQYNVGDVVTLAGLSGTVESMTLRRTSLRGFDGTLYVIPNSQITNVANQSRDFSVTTMNVSVDFSANPDQVIPVLRQIVADVRREPAYKDVFLEEPKVLGVDSIKGSEVIYLISIRTRARQQFDAVRELQRRLRLALEEHRMLPGSPYRVHGGTIAPSAGIAAETKPAPPPDPTAAPPNEANPFSGK